MAKTINIMSKTIEAATYTDVAVRYICGGAAHPDHDTICGSGLETASYGQNIEFLKSFESPTDKMILKIKSSR